MTEAIDHHHQFFVPEQIGSAADKQEGSEGRIAVIQGCGMLTVALSEDSERHSFGGGSEGITNVQITVHGRLDAPGVSFLRKPVDPCITGNVLLLPGSQLFDTQARIHRKLEIPASASPSMQSLAKTLSGKPVGGVRYDGVLRYWPMRVEFASYAAVHILLSFVPRPAPLKRVTVSH